MNHRKEIKHIDAKAYEPLRAFDHYLASTSLNKTHAELIKIRVSQLNGCAFCIDKHTREARQAGETEQRIYLLNVWREVSLFTEAEKAILALCEEMTFIVHQGVSDETYNTALRVLGAKYMTEVMMAIVAMNAWNRVGITTRLQPANSTEQTK